MTKTPDINKWMDYKFGMFIHYGLYSILGQGEWAMFSKQIDKDEYAKLSDRFTAEKFNAPALADLAKRAGMRYMVMTARHHDGFSLFDSKHSIGDFTVMRTPAGRDLIREYTDACRAAGLGVGIYYSPMDWRCEGFFLPGMYRRSALEMRAQCHNQVRELIRNYGKLDILWYDGGEDYWLGHGVHINRFRRPEDYKSNPQYPGFWGERELDEMVRTAQPGIVIDNRLGMRECGDYVTPEKVIGGFNIKEPWETCDTLTEMWGWMPDRPILSLETVVHMLIDVITGGGNLLLNVSPMGDGSIEPAHAERLLEVGAWTKKYADAIYCTRGGPVKNNKEIGGAVNKGDKVWFYIKNKNCTKVRLPLPHDAKPLTVRSLTGEPIQSAVTDGILTAALPESGRDSLASIVEITLNRPVSELYADFDPDTFDAFAQ
ncbi:MAG: glycoside hydrolase family 29 [Ruminococcaceae bacterium]|nr:glycoside hydrolase family 29 [Oscillospiraceae bacterium]